MFSWQTLVDETALATVLPVEHARFATPISEALGLFLERLPTTQQAEIIARQVALPMSASISERLGVLALSCPVLHKLGQVLARDQRLAPQLRYHLRALESLPPTVTVPVDPAELRDSVTSWTSPEAGRLPSSSVRYPAALTLTVYAAFL